MDHHKKSFWPSNAEGWAVVLSIIALILGSAYNGYSKYNGDISTLKSEISDIKSTALVQSNDIKWIKRFLKINGLDGNKTIIHDTTEAGG